MRQFVPLTRIGCCDIVRRQKRSGLMLGGFNVGSHRVK
jgi:hypothetical protein